MDPPAERAAGLSASVTHPKPFAGWGMQETSFTRPETPMRNGPDQLFSTNLIRAQRRPLHHEPF
jgi:hypothetical protein